MFNLLHDNLLIPYWKYLACSHRLYASFYEIINLLHENYPLLQFFLVQVDKMALIPSSFSKDF